MATLRDTQARNILPDSKPLPHRGVKGLSLYPNKNKGQGKWVLRYSSPITKKRRNMGLGAYPAVSIAEAARAAFDAWEQIEKGVDPLEEKAQVKETQQIPDFQTAARLVHAELLPSWRNAKHGQQWINTLENYVFPTLGDLPLDAITPKHIADALRPIWLDIR